MKKIIFLFILSILSIGLCSCTFGFPKDDSNDSSLEDGDNSNDDIIDDSNSNDDNIDDSLDDIEDSLEEDLTNCIFASPNGSGIGTIDNPYSLSNALDNLVKGETLYLLEGTYNISSVIRLRNNGNKDNYYKIYAYQDKEVIFDYGYDPFNNNYSISNGYNSSSNMGLIISGNYYHLKGITITKARANGMRIYGNYNIVENCVFAYNGNTGLHISSSTSTNKSEWSHDNLILNCTSYGNYDWDRSEDSKGEDADGFAAKLCVGVNNVFDGCIAYNNSDDGWDLFTKRGTGAISPVTIKNCVAFQNGYSPDGVELKNGNGFKLGGRALEVSHIVYNCVAFYNKANGFDDNSNSGTITLTNCTSYMNGKSNYAMGRFLEETNIYTSVWIENGVTYGPIEGINKSHNIFNNCISCLGTSKDTYSGQATNSYFYDGSSYYYFNTSSICNSKYSKGTTKSLSNPFICTTIDLSNLGDIHTRYRNSDYSINLGGFLTLNSNYNLGASL